MKSKLLLPVVVVITLLLSTSIYSLYQIEKINANDRLIEEVNEVNFIFKNFIYSQTSLLNSHLSYLLKDPTIQKLLQENNPDKLYEYCLPLFITMKDDYKITHFYFIGANDTCFLRVHNKSISGDVIKRHTLQVSKQTQQPFSGIEIGALGKLTLRYVYPFEIKNKISYYIELGMEIDPGAEFFKTELEEELILTINKKYLTKANWMTGMKNANKEGNWDEYADFVVASKTFNKKIDLKTIESNKSSITSLSYPNGEYYKAASIPLIDVSNQNIGSIIVLSNTTKEEQYMETWRNRLILTGSLLGLILLTFFYRHISNIEDQINTSRNKLEKSEYDLQIQNKSLKIAIDKANESDRLQSAFLANMSHEIRTPMNAIMGFSELLNSNQSEEKKKQFSHLIRQRTLELMNILENIINLSKLEARSMTYNPEKGSIEDLFQKIQSHFVNECEHIYKKKIEITHIIELSELSFHTDFILLKHIMDSILDNACKFTETGAIKFGCKQHESNTILFWVSDTGIGISAEEQAIIFNRFRQADESKTRKYGGNGVGLTISKACVELLGGKIWVESEKAKGSTFYFTVPIARL